MSNRGNIFANIENEFEFASYDEIKEMTLKNAKECLYNYMYITGTDPNTVEPDTVIGILVMGATLGAMGVGYLSIKRMALIKYVFGDIFSDIDMDMVYDNVRQKISENHYEFVESFVGLGNDVAISFLRYVLGIAYIDGKLKDEVGARLETIYAANLIMHFAQSGLEEVPAPKVRLNKEEADVIKFLEKEDKLMTEKELYSHFSFMPKTQLEAVLDGLCKKGLIQYTDNIIGGPHYLLCTSVDDEDFCLDEDSDFDDPDEVFDFTYDEGLFFENDTYKVKIPDGFKIEKGAEGRDFIAYLKDYEDYNDSPIRIYAGREINLSKTMDRNEFYQYAQQTAEISKTLGVDIFTEVFALDTKDVIATCSRTGLTNFHPSVLMGKTTKQFRIDANIRVFESSENIKKCKKTVEKFVSGILYKFAETEVSKPSEQLKNISDSANEEELKQHKAQILSKANSAYLKHIQTNFIVKDYIAIGLKSDGSVIAMGNNHYGNCDVREWRDIISISADSFHTVGLKSDGTVVATGDNEYGQCNVRGWKDIVAISVGDFHTVGLKSDGTVVATGENEHGQCNVSGWKNIVSVYANSNNTIALKSDGTVVATGENEHGQCNVSDWKNIVTISFGYCYTIGLKVDGTVVATGRNEDGQCNVSDWKDIVAISAGEYFTAGLKADGTVVATGDNKFGQCNVSGWKDIVAIFSDELHTVGLKSDGTVVATGENKCGQCNVFDWTDIALPMDADSIKDFHEKARKRITENKSASKGISEKQEYGDIILKNFAKNMQSNIIARDCISLGLKSDGTVVVTGNNHYENCNVQDWKNILGISADDFHTVGLKTDGTVVATGKNENGQCNVSDWEDIIAISVGVDHTVGLKSDGTVMATGKNEDGQCDVSDWKDIVAVYAGGYHTVGLKSDGTVVATGDDEEGQSNVWWWKDIVAIYVDEFFTVGLKYDGTVVATGDNEYGQCNVFGWKNIAEVSVNNSHTVGLKYDGTVVATGKNEYGQCNVSGWKDIVEVYAGIEHTVGLKADGSVVATGKNENGQCNVSGWKDIVAISADELHTIGLKSDGTVVATGDNEEGESNVSDWTDISLPVEAATITEFHKKSKKRIEDAIKRKADLRSVGLCQHCGGTFKGLFKKVCTRCGNQKDY